MELLPCPFCGNKDIELRQTTLRIGKSVYCPNCEAGTAVRDLPLAVEDWNRRALGWTSTKAQMPEEAEVEYDGERGMCSKLVIVAVTKCNGENFVADDIASNGKWYNYGNEMEFEVTHWMPLPPLPNSEVANAR